MEIASGVLVAIPSTTNFGAWLTIATLIAVYPLNLNCLIDADVRRRMRMGMGAAIFR